MSGPFLGGDQVARNDLEREAWRAHSLRRERAAFVVTNALIILLVPLWGIVDAMLVPSLAPSFFKLRLLAAAAAAGALVGLAWSGDLLRNRLLMLGSLLAVGGAVAGMVPAVEDLQPSYVFGLSLIFWGAGMVLPWPLRWTAGAWILVLTAFVITHIAEHGADLRAHAFIGSITYLGSAAAIAGVNSAVRLRLERRAFQAAYELARRNQVLQQLSMTDELTGLTNYRGFITQLERELRRFQRMGHAASLLMLDLDHFKLLNDAHGHEAGNRVLAELASLFRRTLREMDLPARYGGEEFCAIVLAPSDEALAIAERVRRAIEQHPFAGRESLPEGRLTVSIGVAPFLADDRSGHDVIERADAALYRCKQSGRNRVLTA